jgi:hypothetical protein
MNMNTLKNYADVQKALSDFCAAVGVNPARAPHKDFWNTMTYEQFTTGEVPRFKGVKVLVIGNSKDSNIIQILQGIGEQSDNYGPMPPDVSPDKKTTIIAQLSAWIDAKCPK